MSSLPQNLIALDSVALEFSALHAERLKRFSSLCDREASGHKLNKAEKEFVNEAADDLLACSTC